MTEGGFEVVKKRGDAPAQSFQGGRGGREIGTRGGRGGFRGGQPTSPPTQGQE